ncbi:thioredoxin family protein [Agromyces lapidis]|uniref:Thioredoxin family protein n=1 Tax=Agromyces lapidis TaxID=279574 RepID=A0ABV5SUG8_9MICO|nr:thioredoxin family protein [Agromyces lapidis]
MEITLQYFDGCPNWKTADARLTELISGRRDLTLRRELVATAEQAERIGFRGSPSILVDGVDPFADPNAPVGLACRIYATPAGPAGAPTTAQLREVLGDA